MFPLDKYKMLEYPTHAQSFSLYSAIWRTKRATKETRSPGQAQSRRGQIIPGEAAGFTLLFLPVRIPVQL